MTRCVLIVEDDEDLRSEMIEYLVRRGYVVAGCGSLVEARQALEAALAKATPPHRIICDVGLPDGDGLQLLGEFARRLPAAEWLLVSGSHDFERLDAELRSLAELTRPQIIEKPFSLRALVQFVDDDSLGSSPNRD